MLTAKERMLQFVDYQHELVTVFCKKNKLSNSYLNQKGAIGSDKLCNILNNYPNLNADWVITGRGSMLLTVGNAAVAEGVQAVVPIGNANGDNWREKYYTLLEEYNDCLKNANILSKKAVVIKEG